MKQMTLLFMFAVFQFCETTWAGGEAETILRYYDDGETQVFSPHVRASGTAGNDAIEIGAGYAADVVTSSSCDVRTWASKGKISDTRQEISADFSVTLQNGTAGFGYVRSDENDYHSDLYSIGTSRDFFDKNTTVALGFSYGNNHVQSSSDKNFDQLMRVGAISVGLTQVLNKVSLGQVLYDLSVENGYTGSPYRAARILQADGSVLGISEVTPNIRARHSVAVKYNYYFPQYTLSTINAVRLYNDNWGVTSFTIEEQASRPMTPLLTLGLDIRYYQQTQASFYQDKYDRNNLAGFLTGNKTLSSFWSLLIGVRPTFNIGQDWEVYTRAEYYLVKFSNFTDVGLPSDPTDDKLYSIKALIFGAGVSKNF